jgi:hypothetical protein
MFAPGRWDGSLELLGFDSLTIPESRKEPPVLV